MPSKKARYKLTRHFLVDTLEREGTWIGYLAVMPTKRRKKSSSGE